MATSSHWLASTLVQRGESDTYIQNRLENMGIPKDEAKHLIADARKRSELSKNQPLNNTEVFLLLTEAALLLAVLYWLLQGIW